MAATQPSEADPGSEAAVRSNSDDEFFISDCCADDWDWNEEEVEFYRP
jgi:hypothetical protein